MPCARISLLVSLWIFLNVLSACLVLGADGKWTEWTEWESCSASCGKGSRKRYRFCTNPPSSGGGRWCSGKAIDVAECEAPFDCPVDGGWNEWSLWSACSVSCGEGVMNRFRDCNSPAPSNGGRNCPGNPVDVMECVAVKNCPRDGKWSSWSEWSACSVTCGNDGLNFRYRSCNNPPPTAGGKRCEGASRQDRRCRATKKCAVNGQWSEWSEWTSCSSTCGAGVRNRWRKCDNPPPQNGGLDCTREEAGEVQERSCNGTVVFCPVNGEWSDWSEWGDCYSPNCNKQKRTAHVFRQRTCSNPYPSHTGSMCQGTFLSAAFCEDPINCAVNGGWGEWSAWECTIFLASRSRNCDSPPPSNGGKPCKGDKDEIFPCNEEKYREVCSEFEGRDDCPEFEDNDDLDDDQGEMVGNEDDFQPEDFPDEGE